MFTMGDVAERSQWDEEFFYRTFGIDGEIIIDHAWGIEPVTMADIKAYKSEGHSLSSGQVLPRPYKYEEARVFFREMLEGLCADMYSKNLITSWCSWYLSYDWRSLEVCPSYDGPLSMDFYGRIHPKHSVGQSKAAGNNEQPEDNHRPDADAVRREDRPPPALPADGCVCRRYPQGYFGVSDEHVR